MSKTNLVVAALCVSLALTSACARVSPDGTLEGRMRELEKSDVTVIHDHGWAIVPRMVGDKREYWFIAPDEDGASPALYRKQINAGDDGKTVIISECEAPKATCDRLMREFEAMSDEYN